MIDYKLEQKTQVCRKCKVERPTYEFKTDRRNIHDLSYQCKTCDREYSKEYRILHGIKPRRDKDEELAYKKHNVRTRVSSAVRDGRLIRPTNCSECGVECIPHGHHSDYSKPLSVEWLCIECHWAKHKGDER